MSIQEITYFSNMELYTVSLPRLRMRIADVVAPCSVIPSRKSDPDDRTSKCVPGQSMTHPIRSVPTYDGSQIKMTSDLLTRCPLVSEGQLAPVIVKGQRKTKP